METKLCLKFWKKNVHRCKYLGPLRKGGKKDCERVFYNFFYNLFVHHILYYEEDD